MPMFTSQAAIANSGSWVTMTTVRPDSVSERTTCATCRMCSRSSPLVGSSRMTIGRSDANAAAMAMRCFCPPDRDSGCRSANYSRSSRRNTAIAASVLVRLGEFDLVQHGFGEQLAVHVLHHGEARAQSSAAVQPSAVGRDEHAFASGIQSLQASRERRLAGTVETGHGRGAPGWERRPFHVQRVPSLMPVPVVQ